MNRTTITLVCFFLLQSALAFAVDPPAPATGSVTEATLEISTIYKGFKSFAYAMSALCALIGSIRVYTRFQKGDDARSSILVWFGGCAVALVVPSFLDVFFK